MGRLKGRANKPSSPVEPIYRPYFPWDGERPFSLYADKGWALRVRCWDCQHQLEIPGDQLVSRFGPGCTVARLWSNLICSTCKVGRVHVYPVSMPYHRPKEPQGV